ncbi:MAG: hypothetical protein LUG61_01510 [Lachnospiraceae bacterium]|nr:hypothetical protein [Lachnospiraceae bacterium]
MAQTIIEEQQSIGAMDVNEHAAQAIVDWILSNRYSFGEKAVGTCLGTISADQNKAYLFPSLLNDMLTREGYSPWKTLRYLAEQGIVTTKSKRDGGKEYSVSKWFDGRKCRMVEFDLSRYTKTVDALDEDEAAAEIQGEWQQAEMDTTPFEERDEELPF